MPEANKPRHGAKNQIQPQTLQTSGKDSKLNSATATNPDLDSPPTLQHQPEAFTGLAAAFKQLGHTLTRIDMPNSPTRYYASNWGYAKALDSLEEVQAFLQQIGGKL